MVGTVLLVEHYYSCTLFVLSFTKKMNLSTMYVF